MNNPNPFVPKGSLLEQQSLRRSRLKITVGCVLAVSVCALVAMLIEGCKREAPDTQPPVDTNPPVLDLTNTPPATVDTNPPPSSSTLPPPMSPSNAMVMPPPQPPAAVQPPMPVVPAAGSTYEVVAGDTLGKIAKAHGVKLKALEAANPGVDAKKLKIKQVLNIPAPTQSTDSTSATSAPMGATGGETYVVKSGDTLSKIAREHGVRLKALREANPSIASTDHIHVGDKLTIPEKTSPAPAPDTTTAVPVPPPSTPVSVPPPSGLTPTTPAPGH